MGVLHDLASHASGGLRGIQSTQRDWSPFVAHFTKWRAMELLRHAVELNGSPAEIAALLTDADRESATVVEAIGTSQVLRASSPSSADAIPECVCFSECSLPGLLGHCERSGRFGFVFRKSDVFAIGARPCSYVDRATYGELAALGRGSSSHPGLARLFGLANVYSPPGHGQVQDFTHEREWRLFSTLELSSCHPDIIISPRGYVGRVRGWFPQVECVLPIDTLHEWGL
jgi:hypothetical protein